METIQHVFAAPPKQSSAYPKKTLFDDLLKELEKKPFIQDPAHSKQVSGINALLKQAARIAKLGYFEININTGVMKWSEELLDIFETGQGFEMTRGEDRRNYIYRDDLGSVADAFRDAVTGKAKPVTYRILTRTGKLKILKTIFADQRVCGEEGFIFGTTQDITDIKIKQIRIINREKELRSIAESAPVIIIKTNLQLRIRYINQQPEFYLGKKLYSLFHPDCYEEIDLAVQKALHDTKISHFEARSLEIEKPISYRCTIKRVELAEHDTTFIFILKDINESKEFERKIFKATTEAEEGERNRIAAELHDGVCQNLSTIQLMMTTLERTLREVGSNPGLFISGIKDLTLDTIRMTRDLSHELMPLSTVDSDLVDAIRTLVQRQEGSGAIKYEFTLQGRPVPLDPKLSINLFRIFQEFIRNSQKHAEPGEIKVSLFYYPDKIGLTVSDNGKGFDPQEIKLNGIGLYTMEKRVRSFNGTYDLQAEKGKGVKLQVIIPFAF